MSAPHLFRYEGEGEMRSLRPKRADAEFVIGQTYNLVEHHDRSAASHDQFFAALNEAFLNLPEEISARFPTCEHLRKWSLIECGYADSQTFVASSAAEARRLAAFIKPIDEFSIVTITGATVTRWTAKSQSYRAMGKKEFQASKTAVLEYVSSLIGVQSGELEREAGRAA